MVQMNFKDKVALVTGSSRNIGRAIVLELAQQGAAVVVNARSSAEEAISTVEDIKALGGKAISVLADVGDEKQVENLVQQVLNEFGKIDILVNNTGLRQSCSLTKMTTEEWRKVLSVNLDGPFFVVEQLYLV